MARKVPMTGPEAVAALPDSIRIGPHDYKIEKWAAPRKSDCFGDHSFAEQRIGIETGLASSHRAVAVVLHEITHALYDLFGIDGQDDEERVVTVLANGLTQLHRDNPWLAPWIAEACT